MYNLYILRRFRKLVIAFFTYCRGFFLRFMYLRHASWCYPYYWITLSLGFCYCQFVHKHWVQSPREDDTKWAYPLLLPQKELFSSFCHRSDFFTVQWNLLLCNKTFCCATKLFAVQQNLLLCIKAFCYVSKLSAVQQNFLLCNKTFYCALKLSTMQ